MADTPSTDGLRGIDPDIALSVSEEKLDRGLKYVSKSRIKTFLQCPYKFYLKYWCEHRPPGNFYTERGTQIHEAYELFHQNLKEYMDSDGGRGPPERWATLMPDDHQLWSQWLEYIGNFWKFEERRWKEAEYAIDRADATIPGGLDRWPEKLNAWEPVAVEAEAWLGEPPEDYDRADPDYVNEDGPPVGDIPWMGKADAIFHTASVPEVSGNGVVILDYKTGSVPDERYRDEGIFLEGEFYGWLFEKFLDVDAVAGYYPKEDELIISPYPNKQRRFDIKRAALGMQEPPSPDLEDNPDGPDVPENFDYEEQPLCHYGHGKCWFYDQCPSSWGE